MLAAIAATATSTAAIIVIVAIIQSPFFFNVVLYLGYPSISFFYLNLLTLREQTLSSLQSLLPYSTNLIESFNFKTSFYLN